MGVSASLYTFEQRQNEYLQWSMFILSILSNKCYRIYLFLFILSILLFIASSSSSFVFRWFIFGVWQSCVGFFSCLSVFLFLLCVCIHRLQYNVSVHAALPRSISQHFASGKCYLTIIKGNIYDVVPVAISFSWCAFWQHIPLDFHAIHIFRSVHYLVVLGN